MNILIGIPTKESIDIEAAISIMNLDWDGHSITYTHADGAGVYGIAQARNQLCRKAIDLNDPSKMVHRSTKNKELVEHYTNNFGAKLLPIQHPYQIVIDTPSLRDLLNTYTYDWK